METSVVVALISSVASVVIALVAGGLSIWQNAKIRRSQRDLGVFQARLQSDVEVLKQEFQQAAVVHERQSVARSRFEAHRGPLLVAAYDLGERIDTIRSGDFAACLGADEDRRQATLRTTSFRVARYFAVFQALRPTLEFIEARGDVETRAVADLLETIGSTFAADTLDRVEGSCGARFRFWREEQQTIGGLTLTDASDDRLVCINYASFVDEYERRYASWFSSFVSDLGAQDAGESERFERLHGLLARLVVRLDDRRTYTRVDEDGTPTSPEWVVRGLAAGRTRSLKLPVVRAGRAVRCSTSPNAGL